MESTKYPLYAIAIAGGGGIALWAGMSPFLLLVLLACPLMMFFMMRSGMHGGHGQHDPTEHGQPRSASTPHGDPDAPERVNRP